MMASDPSQTRPKLTILATAHLQEKNISKHVAATCCYQKLTIGFTHVTELFAEMRCRDSYTTNSPMKWVPETFTPSLDATAIQKKPAVQAQIIP